MSSVKCPNFKPSNVICQNFKNVNIEISLLKSKFHKVPMSISEFQKQCQMSKFQRTNVKCQYFKGPMLNVKISKDQCKMSKFQRTNVKCQNFKGPMWNVKISKSVMSEFCRWGHTECEKCWKTLKYLMDPLSPPFYINWLFASCRVLAWRGI